MVASLERRRFEQEGHVLGDAPEASVEAGYAGGDTANPTNREVCGGDSGHAEVAQLHFDPAVISYREILARISQRLAAAGVAKGTLAALRLLGLLDVLSNTPAEPSRRAPCARTLSHALATQPVEKCGLEVFFATHDPTTLDRPGGDTGTQYRSAVFYHSPAQREIAEQLIGEFAAQGMFGAPIVSEVTKREGRPIQVDGLAKHTGVSSRGESHPPALAEPGVN
ncbi:MAG: peptide-methionine (S)-S-oxide reductase MsrA, partial [Acidobacteriota bacterium]